MWRSGCEMKWPQAIITRSCQDARWRCKVKRPEKFGFIRSESSADCFLVHAFAIAAMRCRRPARQSVQRMQNEMRLHDQHRHKVQTSWSCTPICPTEIVLHFWRDFNFHHEDAVLVDLLKVSHSCHANIIPQSVPMFFYFIRFLSLLRLSNSIVSTSTTPLFLPTKAFLQSLSTSIIPIMVAKSSISKGLFI